MSRKPHSYTRTAMGAAGTATPGIPQAVNKEDLYAVMAQGTYVFPVTGDAYSSAMIDKRFGKGTTKWICKNQPVEQMTWAPGEATIIEDKLIRETGWIERAGARILNLYRAPPVGDGGDPSAAGPWLDHVKRVYPEDWQYIVTWCAQRVQFPHIKINHALVIGGTMRIGKDSMLRPLVHAIGTWNFQEVNPQNLLSNFNGYVKSIVLRISEARDLGESDRFKFHDHMKTVIAAPPDALRVNEKHVKEYHVPNVVGVIITTNHKADGIYLPADDGRHYVAWSPLTKDDYGTDDEHDEYFKSLHHWLDNGGIRHACAYLKTFDLEGFNPKADPPRTRAFWDIANANRAPEEAGLADVIEGIGNPDALTIEILRSRTLLDPGMTSETLEWLKDARNRRTIGYRLEKCGYTPINNPRRPADGLWKINGARAVIYAKTRTSEQERITAAAAMADP